MTAQPSGSPRLVDERSDAPPGWDDAALRVVGGHVMQSAAWATYRRSQGRATHFLTFDDDHVALVMTRHASLLPGVEAMVRRGPPHAGDNAATAAARAAALATWARDHGARDLFMDPERDADPAYAAAMAAADFEVTVELEPSIHVMRLRLDEHSDPEALFASFSKSTRQRIRAAETGGTSVIDDGDGVHLDGFLGLMRERAEVLGIPLQQGSDYLRGWRALMQAGSARLLVALHDGELVGGLFLFHQGGIWATAYSADKASRRRELPGTMHLVRWTAIRDAFEDGSPAIELGGVDLPGHREPPQKGDPTRGLYEHKRGFGAVWVSREPARRIVLRPMADRVARIRRRAIDTLRGMRR